ncbi:Nicalin-1 [Melipona quadrifasciata]|uniref:BOS complex subunit NCLN n=1 Tax=Melipona quadrifasciata TaxID=166423 RepID=A0A0N0BE53_9HYME|nr:Nicalin-1 [Melipona quadrifasciata]
MWLEECDSFAELCRGYLPYYLLIILPIFIIISPVNPVAASHEFPVYRMHQYDLHGVPHGCRSAPVSLEARSLTGWSTSRHCVVTKALSLTPSLFHSIKHKAGALIVILPERLTELALEEKQHIMSLEESMMFGPETTIPVYFTSWHPDLQTILDDLSNGFITDEKAGSAAEAMFNSISASGYQVVVATGQALAKTDVKVATLHGKLTGTGAEEKLPTIALVTHYDSAGVAPELSFGADSNASGVTMLLEIARLFSSLYSTSRSRPQYNLVFIVTGADTVSTSDNLYVHVSKPPKENSTGGLFYKELKTVSELLNVTTVEGIHKKINLAEETLAWEHERYSIRRLPATTLSSLKSHEDPTRTTILDVIQTGQIDKLYKHTQIGVSKESLSLWFNYLASQPRAAPLLADKNNMLVGTLKEAMARYLGDVKVTLHSPDKQDPEFVFYDVTKAMLNVYSVKPAVFDLFLTIAIIIYLGVIYVIVHNFPRAYTLATRFSIKNVKSS